ncbi:MAG TPA: FHA domain-containing protein [Nannocystaceae bacterium]|nr:FHA domain-containing protein [Nannocystaceae bacterium]
MYSGVVVDEAEDEDDDEAGATLVNGEAAEGDPFDDPFFDAKAPPVFDAPNVVPPISIEPDDVEDDPSVRRTTPQRDVTGEMPGIDLGVDDLAAGLQVVARRRDVHDEEIEELDELDDLVEVADEQAHPRTLWLTLDGRVHAVEKERFVIGRVSAQCDLAIIDANISRQHCAIERVLGVYYVRDLGSTNGVQVEGKRVDDHPIREGDVLVLSGHRLECTFEAPVVEAPPVVAAAVHLGAGTPSPHALTGRHAPLPALLVEEDPEGDLDPDGAIEPLDPGTAVGPAPTAYEARVEQRLVALAEEVAVLKNGMERVLAKLEALKNIDALAQLIQRRVAQAKQPK